MATATRTRPTTEWIPKPLARLTVDQYEAMVDSGIFTKRDRFQLINGILVVKVTIKPPHNIAAKNVRDEFQRLCPSTTWEVRKEEPVRLPPNSEPEPDVAVARGNKHTYATRHPGPADLALVVEVADSILAEDRKLATVYGSAGIPVYWIVKLRGRQVEVYTLKGKAGYGKPRIFKTGQSVPVMIDGKKAGQIAVTDILPRLDQPETANGA